MTHGEDPLPSSPRCHATPRHAAVERLEVRSLLTGTWTTEADFVEATAEVTALSEPLRQGLDLSATEIDQLGVAVGQAGELLLDLGHVLPAEPPEAFAVAVHAFFDALDLLMVSGISTDSSYWADVPLDGHSDQHDDEPFMSRTTQLRVPDGLTAQEELDWLLGAAQNWNETSPVWSGGNQCHQQAEALRDFLRGLGSTNWNISVIGGADNFGNRHHVVLVRPRPENPLEPHIFDPFKGLVHKLDWLLWNNVLDGLQAQAVESMPWRDWRDLYPWHCDKNCPSFDGQPMLPPTWMDDVNGSIFGE